MTRLVCVPPEAQLRPLLGDYNQHVTAKQRQLALGFALAAAALLISAITAEVQPVTLWNKIGNFTSYTGFL